METHAHKAIYDRLLHIHAEGLLRHALLVVGPDGNQKEAFALQLAQDLAYPEAPQVVAKDEASIKVDAIRDLIKKAHRGTLEGGAHVFVLLKAERLTLEAANALLKILEEPPGGVRFILTSAYPERLLDTIRSRLATISLPRLSTGEVQSFLEKEGIAPKVAEHIALQSGGNADFALRLASDSQYVALRTRWEEVLPKLKGQNPGALALFVARESEILDKAYVKGQETLFQHRRRLLKEGMSFLRASLYKAYQKEHHAGLRRGLSALAKGIEDLSSPADPALVATAALLRAQQYISESSSERRPL